MPNRQLGTPFILEGLKPCNIAANAEMIKSIYETYGVIVFRKLLQGDPDFERYLADLRWMFSRLYARHNRKLESNDLGDIIATLATFDPMAGMIVADMATMPNKFVSANRVKFSSWMNAALEAIFGPDAVIASPHAGDTLHLFMPGSVYHKYNLPIHQDYQYLMQGPKQTTLYIGMSNPHSDGGGLEYWPRSNKLGVLKSSLNENGHWEVVDFDRVLHEISSHKAFWEIGDVAIFDSLMCHRSVENETSDKGRVVQILRFSDLTHPDSERFNWRSTVYPGRRSTTFEEAFPELVRR
jgi:hypothetical protein